MVRNNEGTLAFAQDGEVGKELRMCGVMLGLGAKVIGNFLQTNRMMGRL